VNSYQTGEVFGALVVTYLILRLVNGIIRKIRRRPKKTFRQWLTSWIAGPELFLSGMFIAVLAQGNSEADDAPFALAGLFLIVGAAVFCIKVIAALASRLRRRLPMAGGEVPPTPYSQRPSPPGGEAETI